MAVLAREVEDVVEPVKRRSPRRDPAWRRVGIYVVVLVGVVVFAFPFYWLVTTSLKPESQVLQFPPSFLPSSLKWINYPDALKNFPFLRSLGNTMIIVVGVEVGRLVCIPLAAYAFARIKFPLRGPLFIVVLSTMMLPYYVTLIPQYLIFRDLHWLNTFLPLIVPSFFGVGGGFFIFMLRQFYLSIPKEYDDAAMVDGCGRLRIFWYIILPQSKPALAALAIFTFLGEWNDYFGPLIYLTDSSKFTLALSLQLWQVTQQSGLGYKPEPYNHVMAIATLITIVPVVVFFFTQRYFLRGFVVSGVQG
jgi:ABC-type glycerol-3-phosphate transport system permease component